MTESQVRTLIMAMTAALPRDWSFLTREQQKATETVYVRMLADLPYAAANAAVESLLASATSMPKIADVREATLRMINGALRSGGDAWGDVHKLRSYRDLASSALVDPLVFRACERMNWISRRTLTRNGVDVEQWCVTTGENEASDRAQFIKLYEKYAAEARHESNVAHLPAAQRFRNLKDSNTAALPAASDDESPSDVARSGSGRVDFNSLIPRTNK